MYFKWNMMAGFSVLLVASVTWSAEGSATSHEVAFLSADQAWGAKQWPKVREVLSPLIADSTAQAHVRSIARLRFAHSLVAEGRKPEAAEEFRLIAADAAYPDVHRAEATECLAELERVTKSMSARDPEASRVRVPAPPKPGRVLYVKADAREDGDGSKHSPFSSLAAALENARNSDRVSGGTTILLAPGRYPVTERIHIPKELTGTADSPLVIRAATPGSATLYGGKVLKGFSPVSDPAVLRRLPHEARGRVLQCNLKSLGVSDYGELAVRGFGQGDSPPTLELFANGKAQTLARWPNAGLVKAGKLVDPGDPNTNRPSVFTYADERHARWTTAPDAWLSGYFHFLWAGSTLPVGKIDPASHTLATAQPYRLWGMGMNEQQGILYHVFNLLEEIDQPGEWYLDRSSGVLYWYPGGNPANTTVELSLVSETLLSADGVDHLRLDGLVFDCSRFNGLEFKNCNQLVVSGCTIRRMAGSGVIIDGGSRNLLVGCDIHTLGRLGCRVTGGDRPTLTPANHIVANCWFRDYSRIDRTYTPAVQLEGVGNRVAHCLFENSPSSAMRVEGNDHMIEFNEFRHVVLESDDQGAIDMWNNPTYRGVVFRHNLFADIGDGTGQHAGQGGIRFDDVISGMLVYGNVFHRAGRGFGGVQMNCGRDNIMDNNLFIDCPVAVSGGFGNWNGSWQSAQSANLPPEFIMSDLYRARYPELNRMFQPPFLNYLWRNAIIKCGQDIKWSPETYDRTANVIRSEDPGFLSGNEINRRPAPELFASLGLRPIPIEEIGLYEDPMRKAWSAVR